MLSVLILGRGAHALELATGKGGLHHVAGVYGALGGARSDDRVYLVDEQDDLAPGLLDLLHDGFQALLELAAELGAGDHGRHVQRQHAASAQLPGCVAGRYGPGEALYDGRLADPGAPDEHRVVLRPPYEGLHGPGDLRIAAHHGIEPSLFGQGGEIDAVPVEGAVTALGPWIGDPVRAPDLLQGPIQALEIEVELPEQQGDIARVLLRQRDQQVLGADELVVQPVGLRPGPVQHPGGPRRDVYLGRLTGGLGSILQ